MTVPEPTDPEPALAFWRAAREAAPGRARVEIDTLIAVAARLMRDTGLSGRPSDFVAEAVRTLADAGELILPSDATAKARRANYDWRCTPALPLFVTAVRAPPPRPPALRREHAWHPDLAFLAAERRLDKPEIWLAIDAWLKRSGDGTDVVSIRERSFEIFHDEKQLDAALGYKFFRTGAITLRRLRCEEVPEPLAARFCRTARWRSALVIENKDTFRSACLINAELRLFAAVIFGEGDAFPKRAPDLLLLSEECRSRSSVFRRHRRGRVRHRRACRAGRPGAWWTLRLPSRHRPLPGFEGGWPSGWKLWQDECRGQSPSAPVRPGRYGCRSPGRAPHTAGSPGAPRAPGRFFSKGDFSRHTPA